MGFPDGVQTVTVTGHVGLADGQAQRDTVTFTPSPPEVVSAGADFILSADPVTVYPDRSTGEFAVRLLATDATGFTPSGWTYTVARGTRAPYSISLPAASPTVDLADLTPVSADPGTYDLLVPVADLGGAAALDVGQTAGTVAAGNDSRFGQISGVTVTGTPSTGKVPTATSGSAASWQALPAASSGTAGIVRVDGTAADIQPVGSAAAAGSTGQAADAGHVHPVDTSLPGDSNLQWWTYPSDLAGSATVPSAVNVPGKLTLRRVVLHRPMTLGHIWFGVSANDAGATFTNCFLGFYSVSGTTGTLAASTPDLSTDMHTATVYSRALGSSTLYPAGEYYLALLMGQGSTWTLWDLKSSGGGATSNAGLAVPHLTLANLGSGLSALPASIDLTTMSTSLITGGWGSQWYGLS